MYQRLDACPICENHQFENFIIGKDHLLTQESFAIVICSGCGFKFTNPRPTPDQLAKYYKSDDYLSHRIKASNPLQRVYRVARHYTINEKLGWITKLDIDGRSMLDYGCGTGTFLKTAYRRGWQVTGVEPNTLAANEAKAQAVSVYPQIDDLPMGKRFNVITLWHVLEHIPDLNQLLKKLKVALSRNGRMIIAVPNCDSFDANKYKEFWAAYDLPRHLYHFTPTSMKRLIKKHRLKLESAKPLKLDAYYISLLSEKYTGHPNAYLKAIKFGNKSNKWAEHNQQNYSSLIYIVRK